MIKIKRSSHRIFNFLFWTVGLVSFTGISLLFLNGCIAKSYEFAGQNELTEEFKDYWYKGVAEISRFKLNQARYGEIHPGDAVLIFVTEDFFKDKQVKSEYGKREGAISILKLNFIRKFYTGIYPYSMMSSIFTPVDRAQFPQSLKVTTSVQEWCGHTYTQINFRKNRYQVSLHSYFLDEADQQFSLNPARLEDEIWTLIRLNPHSLPVGDIKLIPGTQFSRFAHVKQKVQKAFAKLSEDQDGYVYSVRYNTFPRKLVIKFRKTFPYEILEWEETRPKGKDSGQPLLRTHAIRSHALLIDYWNKNSTAGSKYRKLLGLE